MKCVFAILLTLSVFQPGLYSQTMKQYKAGHVFDISLPAYMIKTSGLNDVASIQYKNEVKGTFGFVVADVKEDMKLADVEFESIQEFYDQFIVEFSKDDEKKTIGKPTTQTKNGINFIEVDYSFFSKEAETDIYYLVGIVETKTSFYKVLSWCAESDKAKYKTDFQKILYSVKD